MSAWQFGVWQPIDTAPPGDGDVLVWAEGAHWIAYRYGSEWYTEGRGILTPVAWMHLPEGPEA